MITADTVHVITTGSYDDMKTLAVCADRADAHMLAGLYNQFTDADGTATVEAVPFIPAGLRDQTLASIAAQLGLPA